MNQVTFKKFGVVTFLGWIGIVSGALAADAPRVAGKKYELLYNPPVETSLGQPALRSPAVVWPEMFDSAQKTIDLGQMYVSGEPGSALDKSIEALERAGKRGVKIRFALEKKMMRASNEETVKRLRAIPNLELKIIEFGKMSEDGIVHAKYFVVDGKSAFLGSHNFDWRALEHIHETGLKIEDPVVVKQLQSIFNQDWKAAADIEKGKKVLTLNKDRPMVDPNQSAYLVASPWALNPKGIGDSEAELVRLIGSAKEELLIQVMDYYPLNYKKNQYYPVIDQALRAAAVRGVKIKLMFSDWNSGKPEIDHLKSLGVIPNVEVKVVSVPQAKSGFIPFARTIHSKYMVVDKKTLWIGTSNWSGGYLDKSRNVEMVLQDPELASQALAIHAQLWNSSLAEKVDSAKTYMPPKRQ